MRFCITIKGRVQGVYFRKYTLEKAEELDIEGFVCNQPDGSVYIEAQGDKDKIDHFIDWCGEGSPMSRVSSVEVELKNHSAFSGFEIIK